MRERSLLHRNDLQRFSAWLAQDGWKAEPVKGDYEVLRAWKPHPLRKKVWIFVYERNGGDHLTVFGRSLSLARQFLRAKKGAAS